MWPVYQGRSSPPPPLCHASPGAILAWPVLLPPSSHSSEWPVTSSVYLFVNPRPFRYNSQRPRPRGPKGAHLKEETKMNKTFSFTAL
jgi:hypothetical protein